MSAEFSNAGFVDPAWNKQSIKKLKSVGSESGPCSSADDVNKDFIVISKTEPPTFSKSSKNTQDQIVSASWKWNDVKGKQIPNNFPLERPVNIVQTLPQEVADRISPFLRERSVVAEYTGSEAQCETSSFLKYSIYLYANGENDTIVEMFKNSGCGFEFFTEREAVMNAAKGNPVSTKSNNAVSTESNNFLVDLKMPGSMYTNDQPQPTRREHEGLLTRAVDRFSPEYRSDEKLFVLQNLASITTPDKSNHESALQMSTLILKNFLQICDLIGEVMDSCMKEASTNELSRGMIHSSFVIFSNIMSVVSKEEKTVANLAEHYNNLANLLVPKLVDYLKQFETKCLHTATIALMCFRLLLMNSSAAKNYADEETGKFVERAKFVGEIRHLRLQEEAESTLSALKLVRI
jgi:hypothetical protein